MNTGEGLQQALEDVDIVIHAASSATKYKDVDIAGTQLLVDAAKHINHMFYISIVGCDQIPFGYYQAKAEAEQIIQNAEVPWSILRATQFHSLLDTFITFGSKIRFLPTDFQFQPIDSSEVAQRMV